MGQTESVKISNPDGKKIAAVIHHPETEESKLAILCPGYLDSKDYDHLVKLADALAESGYTAVRFDPIGTWESEGNISDYTATQYLADVKCVLEYMLRERSYKHILLGGHSMGGFVSILYAAQDRRISTILPIMSPYSLGRPYRKEVIEKWKEEGYRISKRDIPGKTEMRDFRVPYSHAVDRLKYNALNEIKEFHGFSIIVAGELDEVVSPEDVRLIFERANEPKKFILMKGIGHDYRHNLSEIKVVNDTIMAELKPQEHYICTGSCGGVSDKPGTCQAENCERYNQPLKKCDCGDDKHKTR